LSYAERTTVRPSWPTSSPEQGPAGATDARAVFTRIWFSTDEEVLEAKGIKGGVVGSNHPQGRRLSERRFGPRNGTEQLGRVDLVGNQLRHSLAIVGREIGRVPRSGECFDAASLEPRIVSLDGGCPRLPN
jgi:hypothetical protein